MKPFVLMMILTHQPTTFVPATEQFDTLTDCLRELASQTKNILEADGDPANMVSVDMDGHLLPVIYSKRFQAWCAPSHILYPEIKRLIEAAKPLP